MTIVSADDIEREEKWIEGIEIRFETIELEAMKVLQRFGNIA